MTEIRRFAASCPRCGGLDVSAEQMWLVLTDRSERDHYFFHCPGCGQHVRRKAHAIMVRLLERMVPVERIEIPAEALEPHDGPPLTEDDLIDLMLALDAASRGPVDGGNAAGTPRASAPPLPTAARAGRHG